MLNNFVRTSRFLLAAALTVAATLTASAAPARAADMYALITIDNPTANPIHYQVKWGSDGDWKSYTLQPGEFANHAYPLDDDDRAPPPYIRFDNGDDIMVKYHLGFYTSSKWGHDRGKQYAFHVQGSTLVLLTE